MQARLEARGEGIAISSHLAHTCGGYARLHEAWDVSAVRAELFAIVSFHCILPQSYPTRIYQASSHARVSGSLTNRMASMHRITCAENIKRPRKQKCASQVFTIQASGKAFVSHGFDSCKSFEGHESRKTRARASDGDAFVALPWHNGRTS